MNNIKLIVLGLAIMALVTPFLLIGCSSMPVVNCASIVKVKVEVCPVN